MIALRRASLLTSLRDKCCVTGSVCAVQSPAAPSCAGRLQAMHEGVAAAASGRRPRCFSGTPLQHPSGLTLWGEGKGTGIDLPSSRPSYWQPTPPNVFVKRYYYLLKVMGVFSRKAETGVSSEAIFRSIEEQATQSAWWDVLGLQRNWITEQAMLSLHVWLFHNRFKVDYNVPGIFNGRRMQEMLFERFWEDTTLRIRNAGIAEISVNKQLENVQKVSFDDMFSYDAALKADAAVEEGAHAAHGAPGGDGLSGADGERSVNMELAAALWKGVFREAEAADTGAVLRLADYTRRELLSLLTQPHEDVYRGWITWGPVPGESAAARLARQRRMLAGEWREALHPDGRLYFYHTATHETRWDVPPPDAAGGGGGTGLYERRRFALARHLEAHPEQARRLLPNSAPEGSGGGSPVIE